MLTKPQRIQILLHAYDLERLETICKRQKSMGTKKVLYELARIRRRLLAHGEALK